MENYTDNLERRIRRLETETTPQFDVLLYKKNDNVSKNIGEYTIKFNAIKNTSFTVDVLYESATESPTAFLLNDVKISTYKPVIGKNTVTLRVDCDKVENVFTIKYSGSDISVNLIKISGYVKDINDENSITFITKGSIDYLCHSDKRKQTVCIYKVDENSFNSIFEKSNVISASVSHNISDSENIYLFYTDLENNLYYEKINVISGESCESVKLKEKVSAISCSISKEGNAAVYYLQEGKLRLITILKGEIIDVYTGVSNLADVSSTPIYSGVFVAKKYDKTTTLYVKTGDNMEKYSLGSLGTFKVSYEDGGVTLYRRYGNKIYKKTPLTNLSDEVLVAYGDEYYKLGCGKYVTRTKSEINIA